MLAFVRYRSSRVCDNCHLILKHKTRYGLQGFASNSNDAQVQQLQSTDAASSDVTCLDESLLSASNTPLYVGVNISVMYLIIIIYS